MSVADSIVQMAQLNNEWSAEQAQKQMDFQREMSNTAHQREIADLQAAGLNPVLSAKLGGASTPSGAAATADTSWLSAFVQALKEFGEGAVSSAVGAAVAANGGQGSIEPPLYDDNAKKRSVADEAYNSWATKMARGTDYLKVNGFDVSDKDAKAQNSALKKTLNTALTVATLAGAIPAKAAASVRVALTPAVNQSAETLSRNNAEIYRRYDLANQYNSGGKYKNSKTR